MAFVRLQADAVSDLGVRSLRDLPSITYRLACQAIATCSQGMLSLLICSVCKMPTYVLFPLTSISYIYQRCKGLPCQSNVAVIYMKYLTTHHCKCRSRDYSVIMKETYWTYLSGKLLVIFPLPCCYCYDDTKLDILNLLLGQMAKIVKFRWN